MTRKQITEIIESVGDNFRTFGGGKYSNLDNNPIAYALKDQPSQFAAGVDVASVVVHIVKMANKIHSKNLKRYQH